MTTKVEQARIIKEFFVRGRRVKVTQTRTGRFIELGSTKICARIDTDDGIITMTKSALVDINFPKFKEPHARPNI